MKYYKNPKKAYADISTRRPDLPAPRELKPKTEANETHQHIYRIRASYEFAFCNWLLVTYPIAFTNSQQKTNWLAASKDAKDLETFSGFFAEGQLQRVMRIGFFITWTDTWVANKLDPVWHAWLGMLETVPGRVGKRLFIFDCNSIEDHTGALVPRWKLLGQQRGFLLYLQKVRKFKILEAWIGGGGNTASGRCMAVTSCFLQHLLGTPEYREQWPWGTDYLKRAGFKLISDSKEPQVRVALADVEGPIVQLDYTGKNLPKGPRPELHSRDSDSEEVEGEEGEEVESELSELGELSELEAEVVIEVEGAEEDEEDEEEEGAEVEEEGAEEEEDSLAAEQLVNESIKGKGINSKAVKGAKAKRARGGRASKLNSKAIKMVLRGEASKKG